MTSGSIEWLRLYLVLDPDACEGDPVDTAAAAIDAGITCLQLRWKTATDRELHELATTLSETCRQQRTPFIVNDRVDIALAVNASGVHLGVDDLPIESAVRLGRSGFIVGYSPETDAQIVAAEAMGATYLGIGPFAETSTKADAGRALGADEFQRRRLLTNLPVVAIGGITSLNAGAAMTAGANGIAVASAITRHLDPVAATQTLLDALAVDS